ncbi:MAG: ABC transporter substrate-binding protein, partial [Ruminococcus sp.]|nr:ABC transporter substrate-binding protein [Ruminococcus sp.]
MKKIISAILAGAVMCTSAVALAGCGGSKTESKTESTTAASSAASGSATADTPEKGANGELHMATNAFFEPYEYY